MKSMEVSLARVMPDFSDSSSGANGSLRPLKEKCEEAKSLGVVRCDDGEMLIVYDGQPLFTLLLLHSDTSPEIGCYVDKYGKPTHLARYIPWECKASAYAHRGPHLLLFSPGFIEVRTVASGQLVQVIEGGDVRFLYSGLTESDMLVAGMTGNVHDASGLSEKLVELVPTTAIDARASTVRPEQIWDEWEL